MIITHHNSLLIYDDFVTSYVKKTPRGVTFHPLIWSTDPSKAPFLRPAQRDHSGAREDFGGDLKHDVQSHAVPPSKKHGLSSLFWVKLKSLL